MHFPLAIPHVTEANMATVLLPCRLRIHPRQEWSDLYKRENTEELDQFFEYYLKGVKNNFPQTPKVRVSLLSFNKVDMFFSLSIWIGFDTDSYVSGAC